MQERLASLPEGFLPLQDPSQPLPDSNQLQGPERQSLERQSLERQSLERQSLERQLAQSDALRKQAQQSKGCAIQAQVQLRRSHSRAERLAALVNEADQARRGCDACLLFCTTPPVPLAALTLNMPASHALLTLYWWPSKPHSVCCLIREVPVLCLILCGKQGETRCSLTSCDGMRLQLGNVAVNASPCACQCSRWQSLGHRAALPKSVLLQNYIMHSQPVQ